MPKIIPRERELMYLRMLAETGNATLAAREARVSRNWAYKKRDADPSFAHWLRVAGEIARAHRPARMNRDRADGWTAVKEILFLMRLEETCSVWVAAHSVGLSDTSAYNRRLARPGFAAKWDEAERRGWPPRDLPWLEAALCFMEGRPVPTDNPVRFASVGEVISAARGRRFVAKRPEEEEEVGPLHSPAGGVTA